MILNLPIICSKEVLDGYVMPVPLRGAWLYEPFRKSLEKVAGFSSKRTLPAYASEPFYRWFEKHTKQPDHLQK